jgi:guanylate cyclase
VSWLLNRARRLVWGGAELQPNPWDARGTALLNALALTSILLGLLSFPAALLEHELHALPVNFVSQLLVYFVLRITHSGRLWLGALMFCSLTVGAIGAQIALLGPRSGVHWWLVPSMTVPLYIFPMRRTREALIATSAQLAVFLGLLGSEMSEGDLAIGRGWAQVLSVTAIAAISLHSRMAALEMERGVQAERRRADALLANMLPGSVAEELKRGVRTARRHEDVTVLFADLVHFTELSETLPADRVVALLDRIFSAFDALVSRYGLEKIKTVGDAYMAAAGVPETHPRHAESAALCALAMRDALRRISREEGLELHTRIGLNSGPVVAGVIGQTRLSYDLWSDAVNVAARMESHGASDEIQVTRTLADRLQSEGFSVRTRGTVAVKGKGAIETCWLDAAPPGELALERSA